MYTPSLTLIGILVAPHGCLSMLNNVVKFITFTTHKEFYISFIFVSFTLIGGHLFYNLSLFVYFPILGEELITVSCQHDLSFKYVSASQYF